MNKRLVAKILRVCGDKKRFATESAATKFVATLRWAGKLDGPVDVYLCQFCGSYHWGHHRSPWERRRGAEVERRP